MKYNETALILVFSLSIILIACSRKNTTYSSDDIYIDYINNSVDTSTLKCYDEIINNEDYKRLNFNDTSSHEQNTMHMWSAFSYETIIINGVRFQEINLLWSANPEITWSTNPPVAICSFRHNTQEKSFHIFNTKTKKFLDFRVNEGQLYFKDCLDLFKNAYNIK